MEPEAQIALNLIKAINAHDPNRILAILSVQPVFIDSLGFSVNGRREMRRAWVGYFSRVWILPWTNRAESLIRP